MALNDLALTALCAKTESEQVSNNRPQLLSGFIASALPFFSTPSTTSPTSFISNDICDEPKAVQTKRQRSLNTISSRTQKSTYLAKYFELSEVRAFAAVSLPLAFYSSSFRVDAECEVECASFTSHTRRYNVVSARPFERWPFVCCFLHAMCSDNPLNDSPKDQGTTIQHLATRAVKNKDTTIYYSFKYQTVVPQYPVHQH
jgi:hypothetical protein